MLNINKKIKNKNKENGFTLIEMTVYVALIGVIFIVLFEIIFFIMKANNKIIALSKISSDAHNAMERMTYEIINSQYIYLPTSSFSSSDAQLSLATAIGASANEQITFVDFYVENSTLFLKKEGVGLNPIALTSSDVLVSDLEFSYYKNDSRESVTIDMVVSPKNNAMSDSEIHLINTVTLRSF
jgi:type II secretory pathway pseudopilin PulG